MAHRTVKKGKLTFYYDIEQGTQEWLDVRKGRVTCSNALVLANKGKTAAILANVDSAERITPNGNIYAERGHVVEAEYKEIFNKTLTQMRDDYYEKKFNIDECGFITNDDYPDAGYSPDGLIVSGEGENVSIHSFAEYKAYNDFTTDEVTGEINGVSFKHWHATKSLGGIPAACIAQCNMAMIITEVDHMFLFLCNPDASQTDKIIRQLYESDDPRAREILYKNGMLAESGELIKQAQEPTEVCHVWRIDRNEAICDRIKEKLSQPMRYQFTN